MRNSVKDSKIDNILIKEHAEEQPEDRSYQPSMPHSLPLSERKPPFHLTNPFHPAPPAPPARPNLPSSPLDSRSQPADANLEAVIQKEKEILEKELNEHKNRIRKLETDIKEVMRLF